MLAVSAEIAASVRHEAITILDRCWHWLILLNRADEEHEALKVVTELETELTLLESCLRKVNLVARASSDV